MSAKSKKSPVAATFKTGKIKTFNCPPISETISPDGNTMSVLFDAPLLDFRPGQGASKYEETRITVPLFRRPVALGVYPRFAINTAAKGSVEVILGFWGERGRFESVASTEFSNEQWEPRFLVPLSLVPSGSARRMPLVIAYRALTADETGEVLLTLDSIDLEALEE